MVLFCFSVCANTAPTIYSCGLSGQVAIPWLVRGEFGLIIPGTELTELVPRFLLAIIVSAVYLPIAIVGSTHFYTALENFLSVLAYWTTIFIPPVMIEPIVFRRPVSRETYPLDVWDQSSRLPIGIAAVVAGCFVCPITDQALSSADQITGHSCYRCGHVADLVDWVDSEEDTWWSVSSFTASTFVAEINIEGMWRGRWALLLWVLCF